MAKVRLQHRRGTASQWVAANPVLAAGEMGFETDTTYMKVGNGTSAWTALPYTARTVDANALQRAIDLATIKAEAAAASAAAAAISATATGKSKLWISSTTPAGITVGDLWADTSGGI